MLGGELMFVLSYNNALVIEKTIIPPALNLDTVVQHYCRPQKPCSELTP